MLSPNIMKLKLSCQNNKYSNNKHWSWEKWMISIAVSMNYEEQKNRGANKTKFDYKFREDICNTNCKKA